MRRRRRVRVPNDPPLKNDPNRLPTPGEAAWWDWLEGAQRELPAKIRNAALVITDSPGHDPDAKMAVEIGMSIILDKPIVLTIQRGQEISAKLRMVADRVVEVDQPGSPEARELMAVAIADLLQERNLLGDG